MQASQKAEANPNPSANRISMAKSYYTPVWVCDNPEAQAMKPGLLEMVERIQKLEKGTSEKAKSNRGGWRSSSLNTKQPGLAPLTDWITQRIGQIVSHDYSYILDPWINLHYQHGFNVQHNHPDSVLSGVYYISVPEGSGKLAIVDPRPVASFSMIQRYFNYCKDDFTWGTITFTPQEGRLIMFPAWLPHHVEASDSPQTRISLPFNLVVKKKLKP